MAKARIEAEALGKELGTRVSRRGFRVFTKESRRQAIEYAIQRRQEGNSCKEIAKELGVNNWTVAKWLYRPRALTLQRVGFTQVKIIEAERVSAPVVRGAHGVWVEGLSVAEIATLLRGLSCLG